MTVDDHYITKDGDRWDIFCDCPPIPYRGWDWTAIEEGYDEGDTVLQAETREQLLERIEEHAQEQRLDREYDHKMGNLK